MSTYQNLATMAEQFSASAKVLIEKDKVQFYFVILYLLGTSIELYLKAIITVNGNMPKPMHELSELARLANMDAPPFLKMLTHHVYWKSKYHAAKDPIYERSYYSEDSLAINHDDILNYIVELRNRYLESANNF